MACRIRQGLCRRVLLTFSIPTLQIRHFSERRSFRPAARPVRPEVNARQRDAPSGAKVFGYTSSRKPVAVLFSLAPLLRGEGRGEGLLLCRESRTPSPGSLTRSDLSPQAGRG